MNRSVRNGLAIAGMAGGLFFLGQAVASADDGQVADAGNATTQSATGSGDGAANVNVSDAEAKNVQVTEVSTDVDAGDGGDNTAYINTGAASGPADSIPVGTLSAPNGEHKPPAPPATTITVNTGDVTLTQEANGGDVNKSGNVNVSDTGNQTATATNTVSQTATSTEDDHGRNNHHGQNSRGGGHDDGGAANLNSSSAEATNVNKVEVDTDIDAGDGGSNYADINTGIIGNTFYCPPFSTCTFNLTTGNVTVHQSANGGDVNGSGNVNIGDDNKWGHPRADHRARGADADCPKAQPEAKPAAAPAVKPAAAPSRAPVLSSAQPSGQLASTGSDVSLPLTAGLLALGLGIGLTAAGRRRETQTV